MAYAQALNPGQVAAYDPDLSLLKSTGHKLITYHGYADSMIPTQGTIAYREMVKTKMGQTDAQLDDYYRHFRISGMDHCQDGTGAWQIGQNECDATVKKSPDQSVLMALVRWVEDGVAPDTLIGSRYGSGTNSKKLDFQRRHCRYPFQSTYIGNATDDWKDLNNWECK
jgi:feruloyl esterase